MTEKLIEVRHLSHTFNRGRKNTVAAVRDVSFDLHAGETLAIVGASGSGKTTVARAVMGLLKPQAGTILGFGQPLASRQGLRQFRRQAQMVFQDVEGALDPQMRIEDIVAEGLDINHLVATSAARQQRVASLLTAVGLDPSQALRYPHELSGGQRQRVGIARALAVNPRVMIADEPVSALDVSVQAQLLNRLIAIQQQADLAYLIIAHDLAVVGVIADRVAVMQAGRIVELAPTASLYQQPYHPYTRQLLAAMPVADPRRARIQLSQMAAPLAPPDDQLRSFREVAAGHYVWASAAEIGAMVAGR